VGNMGHEGREAGAFSKSPDTHRLDLEILVAGKTDDRKPHGPSFHFSSDNDCDYGIWDNYT